MHSYLLCPRQRDARTQEKQMNRALYCHHFPLILPQSLFKTWHLPLTTGHYVSAVLHRGALLSIWKSIHIINHIKPAARNIYAASDPGSAFPVSLCVCALIQNQPSRVQQVQMKQCLGNVFSTVCVCHYNTADPDELLGHTDFFL